MVSNGHPSQSRRLLFGVLGPLLRRYSLALLLPPSAKRLSLSVAQADEVVASHRSDMLSRPLKNIIECKPGQQCRLGADNRFKVLGQKGAAGMVKTGCAATAWRR